MSCSLKKRQLLLAGCSSRSSCINNNENPKRKSTSCKLANNRSTFTVMLLAMFSVNLALLINSTGAMWANGEDNNNRQHNYYKNRELTLEDVLSQGEEKCINKPCVQSEQCCPGSVCVNMYPTGKRQVTGTCLPIYGVNEGDSCSDDTDCEPGLHCLHNQLTPVSSSSSSSSSSASSPNSDDLLHQQQQRPQSPLSGSSSSSEMLNVVSSFLGSGSSGSSSAKTCQPPGHEMMKKQYNDECSSSSECDSSRGLCCQLIKRHRMTPRRACLYFSDPRICIGSVDVTFARPQPYSHFTPNEHDYFRARIG